MEEMEANQFREFGKAMIDYTAEYLENIRDRRVVPTVEPGYLRPLIPDSAPDKPEKWEDVLKDVERVIMPGSFRRISEVFKLSIVPILCKIYVKMPF
ncbi:hypothetical protein HUJ05_004192 [Dendroctonus ponderosae]|nr:hypothetical protein HUJ05_004192 [Dendroctonus ponderosae]